VRCSHIRSGAQRHSEGGISNHTRRRENTCTQPLSIPVIRPELEIRYLRAVIDNQVAQAQADRAANKQKQIAEEVVSVCGKDYAPQDIAPQGSSASRLVCGSKPKTP
jgi:hypothetical protein